MAIENSLLSKSPYKTILECRQISLSLSSIIYNMPYVSVFSRAMLCITQTNYFSYIHSLLAFCTVNSIQAIQQEILYSILIMVLFFPGLCSVSHKPIIFHISILYQSALLIQYKQYNRKYYTPS